MPPSECPCPFAGLTWITACSVGLAPRLAIAVCARECLCAGECIMKKVKYIHFTYDTDFYPYLGIVEIMRTLWDVLQKQATRITFNKSCSMLLFVGYLPTWINVFFCHLKWHSVNAVWLWVCAWFVCVSVFVCVPFTHRLQKKGENRSGNETVRWSRERRQNELVEGKKPNEFMANINWILGKAKWQKCS